VSVADIVNAIDGPLQAGAAWHGAHEDLGPSVFVMGEVWASVRAAIVEVLSTMTLSQLAADTRGARRAVRSDAAEEVQPSRPSSL
jgi:DNA-binding IscR family transcriptional regulator